MRWKQLVLISALAAGCTQAVRPATPEGRWTLVAVDGAALPANVGAQIRVESGTLELNADGTYSELTESSAGPGALRAQFAGRWRWSGGTVELLDREAGLPFVARWAGSSLEVTGERAMRYAR